MARPIGVDKLSWFVQEFIGMSPKVIPLSLEKKLSCEGDMQAWTLRTSQVQVEPPILLRSLPG